jgi:excisionase family DNA binding protein
MARNTRVPASRIPPLLSARELADQLGVPLSTVHYWRSQGLAPRGFKVGKELRFREDDVVEWLERKRAGTP